MKKGTILFLKFVILLLAIGVLIWLMWFPQLEGRAIDLDLISIYTDPFIIYGYIASIPFFVGLYQAFKLLDYIDRKKAFSQSAINALRIIKFASLSLIGFIIFALIYIRFMAHGDDPAGPSAIGILLSFAAAVIALAAAIFQRLLQEGKFKKL